VNSGPCRINHFEFTKIPDASLVDEASEVRRHNKKALPLCGKNLVIRAFLVEGASEARPHNQMQGSTEGFIK
jgi:hypothetical protein